MRFQLYNITELSKKICLSEDIAMKGSSKSRSFMGILFCIPLAFIFYFAISFSSQNISKDNVKTVTFTVPDGQQYTYSDPNQIEFFVNVIKSAQNINSAVRDISQETPVTLQFDRGDRTIAYDLYLQNNLSGCMAVDSDNKMYILSSDSASELLMRAEFQFVYKKIMLPELAILSASERTVIPPITYDWHYKKVDGNLYADKTSAVYNAETTKLACIRPSSDNKISFSITPDDLAISFATANGTLSVSDLSYISFDKDTEIEVTITAKWYQNSSLNYYGEATYSFPLLYDLPATVTLEKKTYNPGEVAVIGIEHLNKDEVITLETKLNTPGIACFTQGDISFALIPISAENKAGEYTLDFMLSGVSYSEKITVKEADDEKTVLSLGSKSEQDITEDAIQKTAEKLEQVFTNRCAEAYYTFGTAFVKPVDGNIRAKFGSKVILKDNNTKKLLGVMFSAAEGSEVTAAQRGKVVLAESLPATGLTVVIDHGYGIMSCYYNLQSVSVSVGEIVSQNEKIGLSGTAGEDAALTFAVNVNGAFVDPDQFLSMIRIP